MTNNNKYIYDHFGREFWVPLLHAIGYLNDADATATTMDVDGWLHTGDIGYVDEDDEVFIVDRVKELIKFKGFQVCIYIFICL